MIAEFIGLPYADKGRSREGVDCWGLCRLVLAEQGIAVPDYAETYTAACDRASASLAVEAGLADGWQRVDTPRPYDLVILNVALRPWHCGVMVSPDRFLHVPPPGRDGRQSLSCVERIDAPQWSRRIEGYYRHV